MNKIPCLFNIENNKHNINSIREGTEWVLSGEGVARRKYDGTACMFMDGNLYKRYQTRKNKQPPEGFIPCGEVDKNTGKVVGWVLVDSSPSNKYHNIALQTSGVLEDGTYELIGPKIQSNPEGVDGHIFMRHDSATIYEDFPRDVTQMEKYIDDLSIEGVVIYGDDNKMVKIRSRDFK